MQATLSLSLCTKAPLNDVKLAELSAKIVWVKAAAVPVACACSLMLALPHTLALPTPLTLALATWELLSCSSPAPLLPAAAASVQFVCTGQAVDTVLWRSFSSHLSRTLQQPSSRRYRCRSRESELLLLLSLSSVCLESLKRELAAYTEASLLSSLLSHPSYGASLLGAYTYRHLYISVCTFCVCVCVSESVCLQFCV